MVQLPNDAKATGYRETKPYHFEQVFSSEAAQFTGTESEFVAAGLAYRYTQTGTFTRVLVK